MTSTVPRADAVASAYRLLGIGFIAVFVLFLLFAVATAMSPVSAAILERTGGAPLIGAMTSAEYAAILSEHNSPLHVALGAVTAVLWVGFAVLVTRTARRIGLRADTATAGWTATTEWTATIAVVAAWIAAVAWLGTLVLEQVLIAQQGEGFSAGFWTWWFWAQAAVSFPAAVAVASLALSLRGVLGRGWVWVVAALAALCALGAVTVEVPPVAALLLGAVLGVGLLVSARRSRTRTAVLA